MYVLPYLKSVLQLQLVKLLFTTYFWLLAHQPLSNPAFTCNNLKLGGVVEFQYSLFCTAERTS